MEHEMPLVASDRLGPDDVVAVRQHLEAVLASRQFMPSPRLSGFLRYVVEKTLDGEGQEIKEYLVATEVYRRGADYDPQIDSTVRVEASRLRAKLREYYLGQGVCSAVGIELPKGTYVPVFRLQRSVTAPAGQVVDVPVAPACEARIAPRASAPKRYALIVTLVFAAVLGTMGLPFPKTASATGQFDSIAVLPFINLSLDPACDRLAVSLTDAIIAQLVRIPGVRVPARLSLADANDKSLDVVAIGKRTRSGAVLGGSMRREGNRFVVAVQLLNTSDGYHVWADTIEQLGADGIAMPQYVALRVASAVNEHVRGGKSFRNTTNVEDPEALKTYFEADRLLRKRVLNSGWPGTVPPSVLESIALFEKVTRRSPQFARGWVGLAEAHEWAYELDKAHPRSRLADAKASLQRALELDANLPEAHSRLSSIYFYQEGDYTRAEASVRRAIDLNPRDPRTQARYADLLRIRGRLADALNELSRALTLEPGSARLWAQKAVLLHDLGRYDDAIAASDHSLQLNQAAEMPYYSVALWAKGLSLDKKGDLTAAEAEFRKGITSYFEDTWNQPALGYLLARTGRKDEARGILADLEGQRRRGKPVNYGIALIHAGLGQGDLAVQNLERAYAAGDTTLAFLGLEKRFDPLRSDPRFQTLLTKLRS